MLNKYEEMFDNIRDAVLEIAKGLIVSNEMILDGFDSCSTEKFNEASSYIKNISNKTTNIDNDIITILALQAPEAGDLRSMVAYFKITNELLRASANTRTFIKGFLEICDDVDLDVVKEYALPMQRSTVDALKYVLEMLRTDDVDEIEEFYNKVLVAESKTDELYELIETNLLKRSKGVEGFESYHKMLSALRKSEKIADRAVSIASLLMFANVGGEIHNV